MSLHTHVFRLLTVIGLCLLVTCGPTGDTGTNAEPPAKEPEPTGTPVPQTDLSPDIPTDLPTDPTQDQVDEFAWQMFVAVNWPAGTTMRGEPDRTKVIGQPGTVVWDTYKTPEEVFLPGGTPPPDWNTPPTSPCGADTAKSLGMTSKASEDLKLIHQAVGGTLTDQNGQLVRYEIRFDKKEFDYIVTNQFYNYDIQAAATNIDFPDGTVEVKAAWRIFVDGKDVEATRQRYYRVMANITEGGDPSVERELGLIGLHVIQKTPSRPQWVWGTWEHVDNLGHGPKSCTDTDASDAPISLWNPACDVTQCPPNKSTEDNGVPTTIPTQVLRETAIMAGTAAINKTYQDKLCAAVANSPWQYYELVVAQWPERPADPTAVIGEPVPNIAANTSMETYIQLDSSCMGCHDTAKTVNKRTRADFSFVLSHVRPTQGGEQ